jgi:hypothetical protein
MIDEEKKIENVTCMAKPPLCYCCVPTKMRLMMPRAPYTHEFECPNTNKVPKLVFDIKSVTQIVI